MNAIIQFIFRVALEIFLAIDRLETATARRPWPTVLVFTLLIGGISLWLFHLLTR
jgi:hypothetical protein